MLWSNCTDRQTNPNFCWSHMEKIDFYAPASVIPGASSVQVVCTCLHTSVCLSVHLSVILWDSGWPYTICRLVWPNFHGPVIVPCCNRFIMWGHLCSVDTFLVYSKAHLLLITESLLFIKYHIADYFCVFLSFKNYYCNMESSSWQRILNNLIQLYMCAFCSYIQYNYSVLSYRYKL